MVQLSDMTLTNTSERSIVSVEKISQKMFDAINHSITLAGFAAYPVNLPEAIKIRCLWPLLMRFAALKTVKSDRAQGVM